MFSLAALESLINVSGRMLRVVLNAKADFCIPRRSQRVPTRVWMGKWLL